MVLQLVIFLSNGGQMVNYAELEGLSRPEGHWKLGLKLKYGESLKFFLRIISVS
jgi:hypothetical protein